jgi:hypothetical protein
VARHVAVTSTLPVFELDVPGRPRLRREVLQSMTPEAEASYLKWRAERQSADVATSLKKEMQFEHEFAKAGGLLLAGSDPTGIGGVLPGFGDQREVELLVEAGFTPVEAIHVASANGAEFLGESAQSGQRQRRRVPGRVGADRDHCSWQGGRPSGRARRSLHAH